MRHFAVYWPWFKNAIEAWPVDGWRIGNGSPLADAERGNWLWLFSSGRICAEKFKKLQREGSFTDNLGYLLQILIVEKIGPDSGDMGYRITAKRQSCKAVDPPLLIDEWVRPSPWDQTKSIGTLRQNPHVLDQHAVDNLRKLLEKNRPGFLSLLEG